MCVGGEKTLSKTSCICLRRKENLDRTAFSLVVRIWQLWLTPWDQKALAQQSANLMTTERQARAASSKNTMAAAARTMSRAMSGPVTLGDRSRQFGEGYNESWRPYIAANLHFYTTLNVLFIRCVWCFLVLLCCGWITPSLTFA